MSEHKPISSAAAFRKNVGLKRVDLPSGEAVLIRKLNLFDYIALNPANELPIPATGGAGDVTAGESGDTKQKGDWESVNRYGYEMVAKAVVKPRFTADYEESEKNPDVVHVSDLDDRDYMVLLAEIVKHSGVTKEAGRLAETFLADIQRGTGGGTGGTVQ